jgi:hypothetical protein
MTAQAVAHTRLHMDQHPVGTAVRAAIAALLQEAYTPDAATLYNRLWPYVAQAATEAAAGASVVPEASTPVDKRARVWGYHVSFWEISLLGESLVAETDTEHMLGTGSIPGILTALAAEMHGCALSELPAPIRPEAIRAKIPQLRNNLARQQSAVMRISYQSTLEGRACEMCVHFNVLRPA